MIARYTLGVAISTIYDCTEMKQFEHFFFSEVAALQIVMIAY